MSERIKFPLAIDKTTEKIVHAKDVSNGLRCNCKCPVCEQDVIAINNEDNKISPHFRHSVDCNMDGESYLHKLAKKIISESTEILLPAITSHDVSIRCKEYYLFEKKLNELSLMSEDLEDKDYSS